jgi:menaquinone-dependent protoporphyrinogen oxidase
VSAASKHGSTAEIADAIVEVLAGKGHEAAVVAPEEVRSLEGYDAVVLGSAVYAGRWLKPAMELVERFRDELAVLPVWLFSSGPIGDPPKPEEDPVDVAELMQETGAADHRVFPGRLVKRNLSFGEKAVVVALRAPEGDFRDWDEIRGWAAEVAAVLETDG